MIGIIGAMETETAAIRAALEQPKEELVSGVRFTAGIWHGQEVAVATCGIGKVFAALCAEAMILRYHPRCIINTGVAGALAPDLRILDTVVADFTVQHDFDLTAFGDPPAPLAADRALAGQLLRAAATIGVRAVSGTVATGDQFIADPARKNEIRTAFNAACCEMEGGSIAQVCTVNSVPFAVLRTISDGASEKAELDYPAFVDRAAKQSIAILKQFLTEV